MRKEVHQLQQSCYSFLERYEWGDVATAVAAAADFEGTSAAADFAVAAAALDTAAANGIAAGKSAAVAAAVAAVAVVAAVGTAEADVMLAPVPATELRSGTRPATNPGLRIGSEVEHEPVAGLTGEGRPASVQWGFAQL